MYRSLTAAAALAVLLVAAPAAQARDPLAGGTTTLRLDGAVARTLADNGVRVAPVKPARGGVAFPITGGSLDGARGTIEHSGGCVQRRRQVADGAELHGQAGALVPP